MREIKFRAWTGEKMRRCAVSIDGKATMDFGPSNAPLMQFTGLYDRNGKEIYEGDVVTSQGGVRDIRFINGAFVLSEEFGMFYGYEVEIIGNIYDNPKLLEQS